MSTSRRSLLRYSAGAAALALAGPRALAQAKPIRIGTLYDLTGPLAGAGSVPASIGTQIAIDLCNERGGVLGRHKVEPVAADSQSKPEVAINEAERLIHDQNLDIVLGVYSSAHAVPLAAKMESEKKILWITVAVATAVVKDRNLHYTFRANIHSDQYGESSAGILAEYAKPKLGVEPKDLKVSIIYEDGPYGTGVGGACEHYAKAQGMKVALKEAYSATTSDLSALVTKLKRAHGDVILHTGYNPDITLFLRQARESGLRFKALFGQGAGYSQIDKLRASFGSDIDYFCNVDPVPAQLLNPKSLAPGLGDLITIMVERYRARTGSKVVPTHVSMGFNQTWILLQEVLPLAITRYGGADPEAVRRAALDIDIPVGGTIQGYGVKFYPPGTPLSGQNERSSPGITQAYKDKEVLLWPGNIRTAEPILPLPKSSPYAMS